VDMIIQKKKNAAGNAEHLVKNPVTGRGCKCFGCSRMMVDDEGLIYHVLVK